MKQMRNLFWVLVSIILVCTLVGGIYGQRLEAVSGDLNQDGGVLRSIDSFAKVYDLVQKNYAESVDPARVVLGSEGNGSLGAIPGMLRTLDPHSNFFDARTFSRLRETQEGKYYGVGMRILTVPDKMGKWTTTVVEPMPRSPAFLAGLRPGDVILKVDGKPVGGIEGDAVAKMLKGPKGTVVHVSVSREGYDKPLDFAITRGEISGLSVDDYFLIRPGVAYIHIANFSETTNQELTEALRKLGGKDLKGLVLDLRGNPGGLLQAAVDVSDHFLEKRQLIVYHHGRHSSEQRYYARNGDHNEQYPMVVLIDHASASAAEIVTGALQDHDRALVLGQSSFGKGLVQTVYPLSEGTGLALTTAHYYTPSGRLIQRDYTNLSLYDYLYAPEQNQRASRTDIHRTDGGREVFGGGGITPDVVVDESSYNLVQKRLLASSVCPTYLQCGPFFEFGKYYLGIQKTIPREFVPDAKVVEQFRDFLGKKRLTLPEKDVQANFDFIKQHVRNVLVNMVYGEEEAQHLSVQNDVQVRRAVDALPQAAALLDQARKFMAGHPSDLK